MIAANLARRIVLRVLRPRIEDAEASIRVSGQLQIIPRIRTWRIGNEFRRHVVRRPAFIRIMQLPQIQEPRRIVHRLPRRRTSTPAP